MFRKSPFSGSSNLAKSSRTKHLKYAHATLEPLEDRKLLTAATYINEIYFDPPGSGGDLVQEYIEIKGTPGESMDNVYLIFIEGEDVSTQDGEAGVIDRFFDLSGHLLGSNGFLTLRQKDNPYGVHPGTTDLVNTGSGTGWGSGATSSLNTFSQLLSEDKLENGGWTAMLIVNSGGAPGVPTIGQDLDVDNDGLDVATGNVNWTILDRIGVFSEPGEAEFGQLYATINFGPDDITEPSQTEGTYVAVGYEIEFVARYGNAIGSTAVDWHVSNLTDNPLAGYTGTGDFRQSGEPHGAPSFVETNQSVPYGTNLTHSLGFANYPMAAPPIVDLNGTLSGYGYATTWTDTGPVSITNPVPNLARVFNFDANLVSLTATITTGADPNNVLSADTSGTPISQSYNAGAGVLTLSGAATKAQYQTVLRTVKYDNTASGPGATVTVELVGTNAAASSVAATATIGVPLNSTIAGRFLFYNQSGGGATRYDGNNLAINASDDNAIATDKTAYLWENPGAATFANVSSYTKGINGIMIDISGSHPSITADDFIFRVGNNNSPGLWATANAPTSISVRAGAGTGGSDRVTIIWNTGAPLKQWLNVIVLANADTGLAQAGGYPAGHGDQFFFGNAVGNTGLGDTVINSTVTVTDEAGIRANPAALATNIPITNIYDVGRNASVTVADESSARLNGTNSTTALKYLNLTTAPAAPEADGGDGGGDELSPLVASDSGVASALTAPALTSAEIRVPGWIKNRLDSIDLNTGKPARLFQHLHDVNTPGTRKLLQKFDAVADSLGLDDELLELLIDDLK